MSSKSDRRKAAQARAQTNLPAIVPPQHVPLPDGHAPGPKGFVLSQASTFSGPLPPPDLLKQYEEAVPGAGGRIIAMAEAQSAHRQDLERSVITGDILKSHRGLWAGLAIALSAIAGACYVTVSGWPAAGIAIGGTPLIGLVALFVKVSDKRKEELAEKSEKQKRKK